MKKEIEVLKKCWYARHPVHDFNADTGEDMFWQTLLSVFNDMYEIQKPSEWVKLSEKVPSVEEVGFEVLIYQKDAEIVYFAKTNTLKDYKRKDNNLWQKIELPTSGKREEG